MTTLTSSSKRDEGDMVTAFSFLTDRERDAVNALLSMPTAPRPSTAGNGWAENEDDETIDAENMLEGHEEERTRTAIDSEASVCMGERGFEIGTIHTEESEASVPARRLVSLDLPPNGQIGSHHLYSKIKSWLTSTESRRRSFLAADEPK